MKHDTMILVILDLLNMFGLFACYAVIFLLWKKFKGDGHG